MNTYESLDSVLTAAVTIHADAAMQYRQLQQQTDDERVSMLLEDAGRQEERLAKLTREFMDQAEPGLLATRLQYTLEQEPREFVQSLVPAQRPMDIETVGAIGQQLFGYIEELLAGVLRESSAESVQELVQELLQLESAERRNFSREMTSAGDI